MIEITPERQRLLRARWPEGEIQEGHSGMDIFVTEKEAISFPVLLNDGTFGQVTARYSESEKVGDMEAVLVETDSGNRIVVFTVGLRARTRKLRDSNSRDRSASPGIS